jgi:hypothetical protein
MEKEEENKFAKNIQKSESRMKELLGSLKELEVWIFFFLSG